MKTNPKNDSWWGLKITCHTYINDIKIRESLKVILLDLIIV